MLQFVKSSTQQEDGSFTHAVVFGDYPPWMAPETLVVNCSSEEDVNKLISILNASSWDGCC